MFVTATCEPAAARHAADSITVPLAQHHACAYTEALPEKRQGGPGSWVFRLVLCGAPAAFAGVRGR